MDLSEITRLTEVNRRAWDVVARTRPDGLRSAESFARGVGNFDPSELPISSRATIVASCLRRDGHLLLEEMHPLRGCFVGDVVTALARAGMRIELLDEYFSPPESADVPAADVEQLGRFPNDFTLLARKDADR
ncbi:hypothetical protein ABZV93_06275 [Actinopolymorpha sp. NPDC004070]|uniref:hypothetical protein n=1 Tax=Actinopolymorpha sp. NPDC004070 TaxID=3154548 RepID=UPI0033AF969E